MKKVCYVIYLVLSALIGLVSVAFAFIEARFLFAGDWLLSENVFFGFIQSFIRLGFSVYALIIAVLAFVLLKKKNVLFGSFCLLLASCVWIFFFTNFVGEALFILSVVYFISNVSTDVLGCFKK